jgi:hypothetical protein
MYAENEFYIKKGLNSTERDLLMNPSCIFLTCLSILDQILRELREVDHKLNQINKKPFFFVSKSKRIL